MPTRIFLQFGLLDAVKKDKAGRKLRKERKNRAKSALIMLPAEYYIAFLCFAYVVSLLNSFRVPRSRQAQGCRAIKEEVNGSSYGISVTRVDKECSQEHTSRQLHLQEAHNVDFPFSLLYLSFYAIRIRMISNRYSSVIRPLCWFRACIVRHVHSKPLLAYLDVS